MVSLMLNSWQVEMIWLPLPCSCLASRRLSRAGFWQTCLYVTIYGTVPSVFVDDALLGYRISLLHLWYRPAFGEALKWIFFLRWRKKTGFYLVVNMVSRRTMSARTVFPKGGKEAAWVQDMLAIFFFVVPMFPASLALISRRSTRLERLVDATL